MERKLSSITTERLELVPATHTMLAADLNGHDALRRLLHAEVPAKWPPALLDETVRKAFCQMAKEQSDPHFAFWYWILRGADTGERTLIGSGGITAIPGEPGTVGIGYSILDAFQGRGYATEAVGALLPVIFELPGVVRICATTFPELRASVRVLEKTGFVRTGTTEGGEGIEEGTLCFVLER
jgi:ribosomal-protein-alanine N-acetyltransferase